MLQVLSIMTKVLLSPFWLLWKGYNMLWWAFEGFGRPTVSNAPSGPERGSAFEITDSRPLDAERPAPVGLLRAGFAGSLVVSGVAAAIASGLAQSHTLGVTHSWLIWVWTTLVSCLVSVFAVRQVHDIRLAKRNWRQRVRKAVTNAGGRVAHAAASAFHTVRKAGSDTSSINAETPPTPPAAPRQEPAREPKHSGSDILAKLQKGATVAAAFSKHVGHAAWEGSRHAAKTFRAARAAGSTRPQADSTVA
jgi:hypothetical protein